MPIARNAPLASAPPVMEDNSVSKESLAVTELFTAALMPGTGSQQPMRYTKSKASVMSIFFLTSLFLKAFANVWNIITPLLFHQSFQFSQ